MVECLLSVLWVWNQFSAEGHWGFPSQPYVSYREKGILLEDAINTLLIMVI